MGSKDNLFTNGRQVRVREGDERLEMEIGVIWGHEPWNMSSLLSLEKVRKRDSFLEFPG